MMIDFYANERINQTIADKVGLKLAYIPVKAPNQVPYTDSKTCYVPTPQLWWTEKEWFQHFDSNFHEVGHNMGKANDIWRAMEKRDVKTGTIFGTVLNIVDDHRNDRLRCKAFRGMMYYHERVFHTHHDKTLAMAWPEYGENTMFDIVSVLSAFDTNARLTWNKSLDGYVEKFTSKLTGKALEQYHKLMEEYFDRYMAIQTGLHEIDFTRDILDNVFEIPEEEQQEPPSDGEDKGDDKGSESSEGESSDSEGDSSDEGESSDCSEGDGEGSKSDSSEGKSDEVITITYKDFLESEHKSESETKEGGTVKIDYSDIPGTDYKIHTQETTMTINYCEGSTLNPTKFALRDVPRVSIRKLEELLEELNVPAMSAQMRRFLQVETHKRTRFNQKRGKLHSNNLYRILGSDKERASRVFKATSAKLDIDIAVSIVVDCSGSMTHQGKIHVAGAGIVALSDMMTALNINHEVLGFTEFTGGYDSKYPGRTNVLNVYKAFNRKIPRKIIETGFSESTRALKNNADGDSLLHAYHRLIKQKEPRKLMIVLSDGEPACDPRAGDIAAFTKQTIENIELKSPVEIVGIGVLDRSVKYFYNNFEIITKISELPEAMLKILKKAITKR